MAVLTYSETNPAMVRAICRLLATYAEQGLDANQVSALISPPTLAALPGQSNPRTTLEFERTLPAVLSLGLAKSTGGTLRLDTNLFPAKAELGQVDAMLPHVVRRAALAKITGPSLLQSNDGARDLVRAACWFLALNPWSTIGRAGDIEEIQRRHIPDKDKWVIINTTRWPNFVRWSTFVGLARPDATAGPSMLVADPTVAVANELAPAFDGDTELPIGELVKRLAKVCPALDRGTLRRAIEQEYGGSIDATPRDALSPSLGLALIRLERAGRIKLEEQADAPRLRIPQWGTERTCTHVVLRGDS